MENTRLCPHCGKPVIKAIMPEYAWQCEDCFEDFYDFECRGNFDPATDYIGKEVMWDGERWVVDNCDADFKDECEQVSLFLIPIIYQNPELYDEAFRTGKLDIEGYWVEKDLLILRRTKWTKSFPGLRAAATLIVKQSGMQMTWSSETDGMDWKSVQENSQFR